jgi:hypothetical protein
MLVIEWCREFRNRYDNERDWTCIRWIGALL